MLGAALGSGRGSRLRMRPRSSAETAKLTESTTIAYGAVIAPTSTPPSPGPAICAADRLSSSFAFPSTRCGRPTSDGRYDWYATSKKTVKVPVTNPTA